MRAHNVPTFHNSFFIKNSGRVLEKSFAPPLSRLIKKKEDPALYRGFLFLVCGLNAAFFRTLHSAMVSNGKKNRTAYLFHHCLDCHYILLNFKASWSSYCFWSLTSSFIKRLVTAS